MLALWEKSRGEAVFMTVNMTFMTLNVLEDPRRESTHEDCDVVTSRGDPVPWSELLIGVIDRWLTGVVYKQWWERNTQGRFANWNLTLVELFRLDSALTMLMRGSGD